MPTGLAEPSCLTWLILIHGHSVAQDALAKLIQSVWHDNCLTIGSGCGVHSSWHTAQFPSSCLLPASACHDNTSTYSVLALFGAFLLNRSWARGNNCHWSSYARPGCGCAELWVTAPLSPGDEAGFRPKLPVPAVVTSPLGSGRIVGRAHGMVQNVLQVRCDSHPM